MNLDELNLNEFNGLNEFGQAKSFMIFRTIPLA